MKNAMLSLLTTALLLGCAVTELRFSSPKEAAPGSTKKIRFENYWWGFYQASPPLLLNSICEAPGWSKLTTERTVRDFLIALATVGVYTPQTVEIQCATSQKL